MVSGISFGDPLSLEMFCIHYDLNGARFVYKDNVMTPKATVSYTH